MIGAVVPAAGLSRRMGQEKILLPLGHSTILETILEKLTESGISNIVVVLRADLSQAAAQVRRSGARTVINPHPEGEMLSSIRLGLAELSPRVEAFFLWPADHPLVRTETLGALAARASVNRAVIPVYKARRGHPAVIGAQLRSDITGRSLPGGLRELWRVRAEAVEEVAVEDAGVVTNLDTPEEYERALARESGKV